MLKLAFRILRTANTSGSEAMRDNSVEDARFERMPQLPKFPATRIAGACDECSLVAEADHRIANHLALLASYVRLKAADLASEPTELSLDNVRLLLVGVEAQIIAVARLHRALTAGGRRASADLSEHLHTTCAPFMSGLSGPIKLLEDFSAGCLVRPDQVLPITQIVAEVVTNALKHAHAGGEAGTIVVRCSKDDSGAVQVEVMDDGPGFAETFDPRTEGGLGLRLVRAMGKQLGALVAFESTSDGLRFQLTLPN